MHETIEHKLLASLGKTVYNLDLGDSFMECIYLGWSHHTSIALATIDELKISEYFTKNFT